MRARPGRISALAGAAVAASLALPATAHALAPVTVRVSVSGAMQGDGTSWAPAISADGRSVAFASWATTLVAADTNNVSDIFVHDALTGTTVLVSAAADGVLGNASSSEPAISADGRFVAYTSSASNLVPNDTNARADVFVWDATTGVTERVSVGSASEQATGGSSGNPAISADGGVVAYESGATNLVSPDTNGARSDIYVRDRPAGTTQRVSLSSVGVQGVEASNRPALSADGRHVVFDTLSSLDGDTWPGRDVFLRDRAVGTTVKVSIATDGTPATGASSNAAISADGQSVVFESFAANLVLGDENGAADIFRRGAGATELVSMNEAGTATGDMDSTQPAISPDGMVVAFLSNATDLAGLDPNGSMDVFVRVAGATHRVTAPAPAQAGDSIAAPAMSTTGRFVAFDTAAGLVAEDTNAMPDVFRTDRTPPTAPVVDAGPDVVLVEGTPFVGGGTVTDPDSAAWTATADYGAGSEPLLMAAGTFALARTFVDDGVYPVAVAITDETPLTGTDTVTVTVTNAAPTVTLAPAAPATTAAAVAFAGLYSDPGEVDTHTAAWSFGDGTSMPAAPIAGGQISATHAYAMPGTFTATVTVTDDDGDVGQSSTEVVVSDVPPPPGGPSGGTVLGAGWVYSGGSRVLFAGMAHSEDGTTFRRHAGFVIHGPGLLLKATGLTSLDVDGDVAVISGGARMNGRSGYTFEVTVVDGSPDQFGFVVRSDAGTVVFTTNGPLALGAGRIVVDAPGAD